MDLPHCIQEILRAKFDELFHTYPDDPKEALAQVGVWNLKQNNPYTPLQIADTYNECKQKLAQEEQEVLKDTMHPTTREKSQANCLVGIIEAQGDNLELFHDELKEPYVRLAVGDHKEIWHCRSRTFKQWLARIFWQEEGKAPNSDALNTALNVIEGKARFDGKKYQLHNRVAFVNGTLWYDLTDTQWRAVKVTTDGWEIVKDPPILFRRYSHQQAQVEPIVGGDVRALLEFVNIKDEGQELLLLVYVISCFIPDFPHPVPVLYGSQGSAKSTLFRIIKRLVDPSLIELAEYQREARELVQMLAHHWCVFFDNLSSLPEWTSDVLCKAVTGGGFSKRVLYTDEEDIIFSFKRCIGLNGINLVATKADLLERSILFELERIPEEQRREEDKLYRIFEEKRGYVLGGIFSVIVKAIHLRPTLSLPLLPRMADFTAWGCTIAEVLGYNKEIFLQAYRTNIKNQNEEILGNSLIALAVRALMEITDRWEDTPSACLEKLTDTALSIGIKTDREKEWPKAANKLSRILYELKPNLAADGILIDRGKGKRRTIRIQKANITTVYIAESSKIQEINGNISDDTGDDTQTSTSPSSPFESLNQAETDGRDGSDGKFQKLLDEL